MSTERRRLGPHVEQLVGPDSGRYPHGNPLEVTAGGTTVLLDSALHVDPTDADLLLLSHFHEDHTVGASRREGPVAVHHRDAGSVRSWDEFVAEMGFPRGEWEAGMRDEFDWGPVPDVETFADDAVFDVGGGVTVTVIPMPGHTAGHCGFLVEPDRVLYLADVDLSSFGPLYSDRHASVADTRRTLHACEQIDAACYAPFHHKGPLFDRSEFTDALAVYAAKVATRELQVLELLDSGLTGPDAMVGRGVLYRPGPRPSFADEMERAVCAEHLDDLVERGLAVVGDAGYRPA